MNYEQIFEGQHVCDPLPSLGYGVVVKVYKKSVHVQFENHHGRRTIYDLAHIQFLQAA